MSDPYTFAGAVVERARATPGIVALLGDGVRGVFVGVGPPVKALPYIRVTEVGSPIVARTTSGALIRMPECTVSIFAPSDRDTEAVLMAWETAFRPGMEPLELSVGKTMIYAEVTNHWLQEEDVQGPSGRRESRRVVQMTGLIGQDPP